MKKEEGPISKEPLGTVVGLNELPTEQLGYVISILPTYFKVKYGFEPLLWMDWGVKNYLKSDAYLSGNRIKKLCPDQDYSRAPQLLQEFKKRIDDSTDEELFELCRDFEKRLRQGSMEEKTLYYQQMVKAYSEARRDFVRKSEAGFVLNAKLAPNFSGDDVLEAAVIKSFLSEKEHKALRREIYTRDISRQDVYEYNQKLQADDRRRQILHTDLLAIAEELGKDKLDVFFDFLAEEHFGKEAYLKLKEGNLCLMVGVKSIENGPRFLEFAVYSSDDQVRYAKDIQEAYEILKKAEDEGEFGYGQVRYKSNFGENRTPENDVSLFKDLFVEYGDYLKWIDSFVKYMHGAFVFSRMLAINLNKIKGEHDDPEGFTEGIVDRIRNLAGGEITFFIESE